MKLQCNRERRGGERSCVYQCACSAHTTLTHSLAHTHTHAACMCSADHVVLMDFQRDRISRGKVAAQCKTEKKKEKVLRCHVGDRIKHKRTHTKLWRNVVSLCSFSHVCESIYHFFLSVTSSYTVCVISVQMVWIQIMLAFLSAVGAAREKQVGKIEKE